MRKELQVIKYLLDNFSPSDGLIVDLRMANYLLAYSQIGDETKVLQTDETIIVPKKAVHRLIGTGTDAIILEISTGVFDEKDIVRLEDDYSRA